MLSPTFPSSTSAARVLLGAVVAAAGLFLLSACDSGDEDDGDIQTVDGIYSFTRLRFETQASAVDDAEVLDRIESSSVEFVPSNGEFRSRIEFRDDDDEVSTIFVDGAYDVSGGDVELNVDESDAENRRRLLLPDQFSLNIENEAMRLSNLSIEREDVDLTTFSQDEFGGLPPVDGTLQVRLAK